jgi:Lon protease-like protein
MTEMLPLFPLRTVLFPGMRLPLHVFESRYRQLVADLLGSPGPRRFGVIAIRRGSETGAGGVTSLHEIGCVAAVRAVVPREDGRYDLQAVGTERFRLLALDRSRPYLLGRVERLPEQGAGEAAAQQAAGIVRLVQAGFRAYLNALADRGGGPASAAELPDEPFALSCVVGAAMIIDLADRQRLLAAPGPVARLKAERVLLARETGILRATTTRPAPDFSYGRFSQN